MTDQPPDPPSASSASPSPASPRKRPRVHCAVCGKEAHGAVRFETLRPEIAALVAADHPELKSGDTLCAAHLNQYRTRYVSDLLARERGSFPISNGR